MRQALSLCRFTLENRPGEQAAVAPPQQQDLEKTVVVKRSAPAPVALPPRPPEKPAAAQPAKPEYRFCPSCTHANAREAVVCARCGIPLVAPATPATQASVPQSSKMMWILIAAAALVVILMLFLGVLWR